MTTYLIIGVLGLLLLLVALAVGDLLDGALDALAGDAIAAWLTRLLRAGTSGASPRADDTVGREAVVLTAIPADGYGTVKVLVGGHEMRLNARLDTDHPIPVEPGTRVHVTGSVSPTAVTVAPTWRELG